MCGHYSCAVKPSQVCVSNFAQPQRERVSKNVRASPRCRTLTRHETLAPTPGRGHHKLSDQLQRPARSQIILHIACRPEHMWHRVSRRLSGRLGGPTARCLSVCSARARPPASLPLVRKGDGEGWIIWRARRERLEALRGVSTRKHMTCRWGRLSKTLQMFVPVALVSVGMLCFFCRFLCTSKLTSGVRSVQTHGGMSGFWLYFFTLKVQQQGCYTFFRAVLAF